VTAFAEASAEKEVLRGHVIHTDSSTLFGAAEGGLPVFLAQTRGAGRIVTASLQLVDLRPGEVPVEVRGGGADESFMDTLLVGRTFLLADPAWSDAFVGREGVAVVLASKKIVIRVHAEGTPAGPSQRCSRR
jgi:hypothetical protein